MQTGIHFMPVDFLETFSQRAKVVSVFPKFDRHAGPIQMTEYLHSNWTTLGQQRSPCIYTMH